MLFALAVLAVGVLSVSTLMRRPAVPPAKPPDAAGDADDDAPHYTGSIIIPDPDSKRCRHLLFDNVTGQIREVAPRECGEFASEDNSTEGRVSAIRRSFAKRPVN